MPFRETHHIAGAAVKLAETKGVPLDKVSRPLFPPLLTYPCSPRTPQPAAHTTHPRIPPHPPALINQLTLADLQSLNPLFAEDVMLLWSYENSAQSRNSAGGSSKERVLEQVNRRLPHAAPSRVDDLT